MVDTWLTAEEAARRLGIERATLYAYVSRGLLPRERAVDGRASRFRRVDVERLADQRGTRRPAAAVVTSAITRITDDVLLYRGEDARDLSRRHSFEGVATFLWAGVADDRPWRAPAAPRRVAAQAVAALGPDVAVRDRLRVAFAAAATADPGRFNRDPPAVAATTAQLLGAVVPALAPGRPPPRDTRLAGVLWQRLAGTRPAPEDEAALDRALSMLADHELAASTVAVRVAASARADPPACISAGLGVLAGHLHGGASAAVHRMFAEAGEPRRVQSVVAERQRGGEPVPGFGHLVYRKADPRLDAIRAAMRRSAALKRGAALLDAAVDAVRRPPPNVDLALGALTVAAGMAPDAGEVIFALARTAGWIAHALEEYEEAPLRFRGRAVVATTG